MDRKVSYALIFRSRDLWLLYLGGIPAIYALWVVGTWAPAIFKEMGVETLAQSSFYSSLLGISAIPGLALTGLISDRLVRREKGRKVLIAVEFFLISFCMLALGYGLRVKMNIAVFTFFFFMAGFFIWGHWAAFYALLPDIRSRFPVPCPIVRRTPSNGKCLQSPPVFRVLRHALTP